MIQTLQILPQALTSNTDNINFTTIDVRTRTATCRGWLQYMNGGSDFTIIGGGRFKVTFNANVTAETAGALALALKSSLGSNIALNAWISSALYPLKSGTSGNDLFSLKLSKKDE